MNHFAIFIGADSTQRLPFLLIDERTQIHLANSCLHDCITCGLFS